MKLISYIRVSTGKQQQSGLGIEAQKAAIAAYAASIGATITAEYIEVESGRNNARPMLHSAMREARLVGGRLAIARLDRLARNAAFLLTLRDSGVDFVCCDNPHATPLTIGVLAVVAEEESRLISQRTKAAMAAAKERGQTFGNPRGAEYLRRAGQGNHAAVSTIKNRANARAADLSDVLEHVTAQGHMTLQAQADELNRRGIRTARGGLWHPSRVSNLRKRLAA